MNDGSLRSYNAIIESTLSKAISLAAQSPKNKALNRRGISGLCQLQGPTGGGKTSCLFQRGHDDNLPPALEVISRNGYQAIFVTHRWNILHEVYKNASEAMSSDGSTITVSVLYAQSENLVAAVKQQPLPHENGYLASDLPCPFSSFEDMDKVGLFSKQETKEQLISSCKKIKQVATRIERMKTGPNFSSEYLALDEEKLGRLCSYVERLLLANMKGLEKQLKNNYKKYGDESEQYKAAEERLICFRKNKWVRRVFPGIVWRDEKQHLLIMTTQKLFSSFYDGESKVRMSSGDLAGHVIFIDEFDYQADVLQQLLSQAQLVQEPPECLGQLLEGGKRLLKRMKLVDVEPIPKIYASLSELIQDLENSLTEKKINLSDARALLVPIEQQSCFKTQYLFRSDHLVTSERLSMQRVEHGYEVRIAEPSQELTSDALPVGDFLRLMEQFIRRFSLLVSDISVSQDEAQDYLSKLSRLLFDSANDYRPSYYSTALPNVSMFSLPRADLPELDAIRKSNLLPNSHANIFGLANWLLKQNAADADIDPLRLQIKRAFLPTTPEGLLVSLCSRNLVYGLSATSCIERAVGSFDLRWIQSAIKYIAEARTGNKETSFLGNKFDKRPDSWFKKPIPYLPCKDDLANQKDVIQHIQQTKKSIRKSVLSLCIDKELSQHDDKVDNELMNSLPYSFFQMDEMPISQFTYDHRSNLLLNILHVIEMSSKKPKHKGQLVFVNSIRFFKKWLFEDEANLSRKKANWFQQSEVHIEEVIPYEFCSGFEDVFIPVTAHGNEMILCLLTAESQKRSHFNDVYQAAFESDRIVLVLTQTASATNGINLDFTLPETGKQMDLSCLYILESRHFYFSSSEGSDDGVNMSHAGYQLRNLEKLMRAGEISRQQHRKYILPIMENNSQGIAELNSIYKNTSDYIKNTASDIQQQIGRIERAWNHVPNVEIHLSKELANILNKFSSLPVYINNKNQISDLNNQLLDELLERNECEQIDLLALLMTPQQKGELAENIIDVKLVQGIREARESGIDQSNIISIWNQLGKAVLQFDYAWKPIENVFGINSELYQWACIEVPPNKKRKTLWYDPDTWQFFNEQQTPKLINFNPTRLYEHIRKSPVIIDWFNKRGYRTSFYPEANNLEEQYTYHPKVIQRLLQGRLGEESIKALLSDRQIVTSSRVDNIRSFELFDFKVKGKPFFIDAKFWGNNTLDEADEKYQKWLADGAKNETAPMGLIGKLEALKTIYGKNAKLVIANFVGRFSEQPIHCFDEKLKSSSAATSSIFILDGCITSETIEQYTLGFEQLVCIIESEAKDQIEL